MISRICLIRCILDLLLILRKWTRRQTFTLCSLMLIISRKRRRELKKKLMVFSNLKWKQAKQRLTLRKSPLSGCMVSPKIRIQYLWASEELSHIFSWDFLLGLILISILLTLSRLNSTDKVKIERSWLYFKKSLFEIWWNSFLFSPLNLLSKKLRRIA